MPLDDTTPDGRVYGMQIGVVTRNDDPEKLCRVKIRIPGFIEPESNWAFPMGTMGGGSKERGAYWTPEVGAEVAVWFRGGDVDHPHYMAAHWGIPASGSEASSAHASVAVEDVPKVRAIETPRFLIVTDDRSGSESLVIKDKTNDDLIRIADGTVTVEGTTKLELKGGPAVEVNSGSTPVAKEGSGTTGHSHAIAGVAGPYPVIFTPVASTVSATDSIAVGQGSGDVKVP